METKSIRLLRELISHEMGKNINTSPFLVAEYIKPTMTDWVLYNKEINQQLAFINDMIERDFIKFSRQGEIDFLKENIYKTAIRQDAKWFDEYKLNVQWKTKGEEFLNNYDSVSSTIKTNTATVTNYKLQKYVSIISIILALGAGLVSLLTYLKDNEVQTKMVLLQMQIDSLKKEMKPIKPIQIQKPSPKKMIQD